MRFLFDRLRIGSWLIATLLAGTLSAHAAGARTYVVLRGVEEAPGATTGMRAEVEKLFADAIAARPEFTVEAPPGMPSDPAEFAEALAARHMKAYELSLRVLEVTRSVEPPAPGKSLRVLKRGIRLSVVGDTLPEKIMAVGGDGEAEAAGEVRKSDDLDKEGKQLLMDAAKDAVAQAVQMTAAKLNSPAASSHRKRHPKKP